MDFQTGGDASNNSAVVELLWRAQSMCAHPDEEETRVN